MARHRSFSFEFKRQVVLSTFSKVGEGMRELARKHSLSRNLLRLWVQKYEAGELTDEVVDAARIAEYEGKIAELERAVGQLTMEVDLLKKGVQLGRQRSVADLLHRKRPEGISVTGGCRTDEAGAIHLLLPQPPLRRAKNYRA